MLLNKLIWIKKNCSVGIIDSNEDGVILVKRHIEINGKTHRPTWIWPFDYCRRYKEIKQIKIGLVNKYCWSCFCKHVNLFLYSNINTKYRFKCKHESSSSVQFSNSVGSNSLWPHGLQHTKFPCPLPTLRAYSNSCPLSWWCHPTISSSVFPFSSCPQYFPASRSSPISGLCIRWPKSWSFSISPSKEYLELISLRMTGVISLLSKRFSRVFSSTTVQKHQFFGAQPSLWANSHIRTWLLEKT